MHNILVVEDDSDLNQAVCYALQKSGYGVVSAESIAEARRIFVSRQVELVLLDVNLPDGEGYTLCRWLKEQQAELPVIYLTARDLEEDAINGYESGAEDYIMKPFSMRILLHKLDVILRRNSRSGRLIFSDDHCRSIWSKPW